MSTSDQMATATIYRFPTEKVRAQAARVRARSVATLERAASEQGSPRVVTGHCWYHEEAIRDAVNGRSDD